MWQWIYVCVFLGSAFSAPSYNRLNNIIRHYEVVSYDAESLHQDHHRAKRSLDTQVLVPINVFGIESLTLFRDMDIFSSDFELENPTGEFSVELDRTYRGSVTGRKNSTAYGVISSQGVFEGKFTLEGEHYAVERASRYFEKPDFHSLVYRFSDIETEKIKSTSTCASQDLYEKTKDALRPPVVDTVKEEAEQPIFVGNHATDGTLKYLAAHNRHKRAIDYTKTQCTLYIEADHLYYEYWDSSDETVLNQFAIHVQGINEIYPLTDFDEDGSGDGITFIVKKVKLWRSKDEAGYKFPGNYDVETYLTMFSDDSDFDAYCLAYIFTYRDFDGGTLGLAWTGDTSTAGGVCERMAVFGGQQKALNAGLVSVLNYGEDMPFLISRLTLAHEVGHNFGSPHDSEDDSQCAPGGDAGNYIMFAKATDGNKDNNDEFSICSVRAMHPVMTLKARDETDGCFIVPITEICGNGVVEGDEECDCGYDTQCEDNCCVPQTDAGDPNACQRVSTAACSPSEGPCCGEDCQYITPEQNVTCRGDNGCVDFAICNGTSVFCPESENKPDLSICSSTKVCLNGECAGSLCLIHNKTECQCKPSDPDDWTDTKLCHLCCQDSSNSSTDNTCYDSYDLEGVPDKDQVAGAPCNDYEGYCDVFLKCREVIPDGILNQLLSINAIKSWFSSNWYYILVGFILLIVALILMVKFCKPKKKSDKPKKKKKKDGPNKVGPTPAKKGPPSSSHAKTPPKAKPDPGQPGPYPYPGQPYGAVPYPGAGGYPPPYMGGAPPPMPPGGVPPMAPAAPMPGAMTGPPPNQYGAADAGVPMPQQMDPPGVLPQ